MEKQVKKASKAGIDRFVTSQIRKSDKAPASFKRMKRLGKETAKGLKVKGKKLNIPWGLLLVLIPGLIAIYLAIISMKKPKDGIGEEFDQHVDLKGRDEKGLLNDFGYK